MPIRGRLTGIGRLQRAKTSKEPLGENIYKAPEQPQKNARTKIGHFNERIVKVDHPDWGMTCRTPDVESITRTLGVMVSAHSNRRFRVLFRERGFYADFFE